MKQFTKDAESGSCDACGIGPIALYLLPNSEHVCARCFVRLRAIVVGNANYLADQDMPLSASTHNAVPKRPQISEKLRGKRFGIDSFIYKIRTKVAGVSFNNESGRDRQKNIEFCRPGDEVLLLHDPENIHDPNTVGVFTVANQLQIGNLDAILARKMAKWRRRQLGCYAFINDITGGISGYELLGVNLLIFIIGPKTPQVEIDRYIENLKLRSILNAKQYNSRELGISSNEEITLEMIQKAHRLKHDARLGL